MTGEEEAVGRHCLRTDRRAALAPAKAPDVLARVRREEKRGKRRPQRKPSCFTVNKLWADFRVIPVKERIDPGTGIHLAPRQGQPVPFKIKPGRC